MKSIPNLLIVYDNSVLLEYLEAELKKLRLNLIIAKSVSEALGKTREKEIILAIIDLQMPKMNGIKLALKLNKEPSVRKVPVIFLTSGRYNEKELLKGYDSGAVDFILKPFHNHILLSKIIVFLDLFNQKQSIQSEAALLRKNASEVTRVNVALKKSEERYRSYIDNAPDGVFVAEKSGRFLEVNPAICRMTEYSKEELLEMSILDLLPEESFEDVLTPFEKVFSFGTLKADLSFISKSMNKRWWTLEAVKLNERRVLGFIKDITKRVELEESLRTYHIELEMQNNELTLAKEKAEVASYKYSDLYNFAPSGYVTLSADKIIQELNYSGSRLLGLSEQRPTLVNDHFDFYISTTTLPVFNAFFTNLFNTRTKGSCEVMLETEDYQPNYVHIEGVITENGKQGLLNIIDITERKQAEYTLKISEEKYKTMLNSSPDGILLIDLNGIITEISDIGLELFGADFKNDLVGKYFNLFVPPDENKTLNDLFEKAMNEGLAQNIELKIKKKNQLIFAAETSATLIQESDGTPLSFMLIIRDISQRRKMETKQIHADRMANLGEMASGIAHEINQPLNIISMVMDKILFVTDKNVTVDIEFLKNKSDIIFENITRIRNIIDHIRAFSRSHDDFVLTAFDINMSIENAASMIMEQFKHLGITLNLQLDRQIPQLVGNTYKFEQVIVNLLTNAKDAVLEKKSKSKDHYDMIVEIKTFQENQFLIVEIKDNGIGISKDDIHNIMLPFYTTKDEGKGTGLGLSICYQILKEMNGTIDIASENLLGTRIKLMLEIEKKK